MSDYIPLYQEDIFNTALITPETLNKNSEIKEIYGDVFVELFRAIKELEVGEYNKIVTAWEREYLLINV